MKYINFTQKVAKEITKDYLYEITEELTEGNSVLYFFTDNTGYRSCVRTTVGIDRDFFEIVELTEEDFNEE